MPAADRDAEEEPGRPRCGGRAAMMGVKGGVGTTAAGRPRKTDRPDRQRRRAATGRTDGRGGAWDDTAARPGIQTRPAGAPRRREPTERPRDGMTDEPGKLAELIDARPERGRADGPTRTTSADRLLGSTPGGSPAKPPAQRCRGLRRAILYPSGLGGAAPTDPPPPPPPPPELGMAQVNPGSSRDRPSGPGPGAGSRTLAGTRRRRPWRSKSSRSHRAAARRGARRR